MWRYRKVYPILLIFLWCFGMLQTQAVYEGIPNVSISADGNAFTTHAGDTNYEWYKKGTEVYTGVTGNLREAKDGEHEYAKICQDTVPIEKWVVNWSDAKCIHATYPSGNMIYGELFHKKSCNMPYYSGWVAYCADCKEPAFHTYIYMSDETAKKFTYVDLSKGYYYKCPGCDNLEMAVQFEKHVCKDVSANRYFVRYHANLGEGYMEKSVHMVNNATVYEGQEVTPQTTLNLNTYTRKGYEFVGWNTKQDGSGESYADGAEIFNLSMEQEANVVLYAQWRKCESTLELDPAGGSYAGKQEITQIKGKYGTEYALDLSALIPPAGYTVHFDTRGGEAVADCVGTKEFAEWSCSQPFHGSLSGNSYAFWGPDGGVDRITAIYGDVAILLPAAQRTGYSFAGWYADKECTQPIGREGDKYVPARETTLYAGWVELLLTAEDNYTTNQGKGAVDLAWNQKDELEKVYLVYQRTEDTDWKQIEQAQESAQSYQISKTISFTGAQGYYTVPYSGFYTLTLSGAQGGNYGTCQGGKGGQVQAVIYLKRGEKLNYVIGGQNGFSGGGQGSIYANGGGYSMVSTESQGVLLIAGGGGGASALKAGQAGGSAAHVVTSKTGQSGATGGGGGYQGGVAGKAETHQHIDRCKHVHTGTPTSYGGCYTKAVECGSTDISKVEVRRSFYYGNVAEDNSHKFCERCGSDECGGHLDIYYRYTCNKCGDIKYYYNFVSYTKCTASTYVVNCDKSEEYTCGMTAGQVLSAEPAYGGSNYVNTAECVDYQQAAGAQTGNGKLTIVSKRIGMVQDNVLPGVEATDTAPPEAIDEASILKTALGEAEVRIAFAKPADNGTAYYHMVESYDKTTDMKLCTSNQTKNILTSGVVGYWYVVDESAGTIAGVNHKYYEEDAENPFLVVEVSEGVKYLHVAAVDKAGNIGPTRHVLLSTQDVIYWPLLTEQLQIEEGSNIYPAVAEDTYYVKADDSTPFMLTLEGLLCGTPREEYQINLAGFQLKNLSDVSQVGQLSILIPNRESVVAGTYTYPMSKLQKKQEGILALQDASHTVAKRYNMCKSLTTMQKFTLSRIYDGQLFQVTPRVAAVGEKKTVWSQEETDLEHSIYLIADGKGPDITGLEELENLENLELTEKEGMTVELRATDSGSGLAKFYVEVRNLENGIIVRYTDDSLTSRIVLELTEENEVFHGTFAIGVYAEDHVGNETANQNNLLNAGLSAYVERILEPHTPVFKRGESGILHIETWGYIEKVEVSFPATLTAQDASLDRTFVYEVPAYLQTEEIPFMIPFSVPDGEMTVYVKAYKAGTELEAEPELVTITVKGSILDELRTRLR